MIWYVYDKNRAGADATFFHDKQKALRWKLERAAMTGGHMVIKWCHPESVPNGQTIY